MSRARFGARGVQFSGRGLNPPAMLVLVAPAPTDRAGTSRAHIPPEFSSAISPPCIWRWRALFRNSVPMTADRHNARRGAADRLTLCSGSRVEGSGRSRHYRVDLGGRGQGSVPQQIEHSAERGRHAVSSNSSAGSRTLCARTAHACATQPSAPN